MEHYQAVYSLLKTALWGYSRYPLNLENDVDWPAVYQEMRDHAVESLVVDVLDGAKGLDMQTRRQWIFSSTKRISCWQRIMKEQTDIFAAFREEKIPVVILKGAAASRYYPVPEYRAMGDIDLIVCPEDFDRSYELLIRSGYREVSDDGDRHVGLKKSEIEVELHRKFTDLTDPKIARVFDREIYSGIGRLREATLEGYRFPMLPELENGLVLLAHIDQHMEVGLGLRQIVDWMLFVDQKLDDAWWNREFGDWVRRLGLETLALTVTRMCQMYLGLREDGISWCAGADEQLCWELMELTMKRGNFGRKIGESRKAIPNLMAMSSLTKTIELLQKRGLDNWQAAKKYPVLRPFAWIYQFFRYLRRGLQRKDPIRQILRDIRESRVQEDVMQRLNVGNRAKNVLDSSEDEK